MFNYVPKATLPNGATIIDFAYSDSLGYWVVVASWGKEFVRWCCDKNGNCCWGKYCKTYDEAYNLFIETLVRCNAGVA